MTVVSNIFIDHYMPYADGEFVKVYLYLLRCAGAGQSITISSLAANLKRTKADATASLTYWETKGLLHLTMDTNQQILSIQLLPIPEQHDKSITEAELSSTKEPDAAMRSATPIPEKVTLGPVELSRKMEEKNLGQMIFAVETYLSKQLSVTDLNTLFYLHDTLHFSTDMIEYLVEHCVLLNKKSLRYIETVALSWYSEGIDTVKKAKENAKTYNKNYFSIMKAFGLSGRNPGKIEADYIKKWLDEYGFSISIVLEACNRTLTATSQPSFPYTDKILTDWKNAGVHSTSDIKALDIKHQSVKKTDSPPKKTSPAPNRFHNFEQRSYDYADLEQRFIKKANGITSESR